jgi:hypothetical protein
VVVAHGGNGDVDDAQVVSLDPNELERFRQVEDEPIPGFSCLDNLYNDPVKNSQKKPPVEIRLELWKWQQMTNF